METHSDGLFGLHQVSGWVSVTRTVGTRTPVMMTEMIDQGNDDDVQEVIETGFRSHSGFVWVLAKLE